MKRTIAIAEQYVIVVAAVNTVQVFKGKKGQAKMAEQVIEIATTAHFELPQGLLKALVDASLGDDTSPHELSTTPAETAVTEGPPTKKIKNEAGAHRAKMKVEPSAASLFNFSTASSSTATPATSSAAPASADGSMAGTEPTTPSSNTKRAPRAPRRGKSDP